MFGKLFGRRKAVEADEPAAVQPVPAVRPRPVAAKAIPTEKAASGFNPYDTGGFKRQNTWEKIPRR